MVTATEPRDLLIWRALTPMADGFVPHVKRHWLFTGRSHGETCNMVVELVREMAPRRYAIHAVFAHNAWHCPDTASMTDLQPVDN